MIVIRWNPDNYKVLNGKRKMLRNERLELLLTLMNNIDKIKFDTKIFIIYMFYSNDNELIAKNINHKLVYDIKDLIDIYVKI